MSRGRQRGPACRKARFARRAARAGAGCLLLLAGCVAESGALDRDPLLGGPPLPRAAAPASPYAAVTHPAPPALPTTPADPPPNESAGPAALASATGSAGASATPTGGARLSGPQPGDTGRLTPVGVSAPGVTPGPSAPAPAGLDGATFEQLQAMLAARGVAWQVLEAEGRTGRWRFTCGIPNPQASGAWRNYEAVGGGPNGLDAIRAVLREIDRTQGPPGGAALR